MPETTVAALITMTINGEEQLLLTRRAVPPFQHTGACLVGILIAMNGRRMPLSARCRKKPAWPLMRVSLPTSTRSCLIRASMPSSSCSLGLEPEP
jgi:hypothetical protein